MIPELGPKASPPSHPSCKGEAELAGWGEALAFNHHGLELHSHSPAAKHFPSCFPCSQWCSTSLSCHWCLRTLQRSLQGSSFQSSLENPARSSFQPSASRTAASAALLSVALQAWRQWDFWLRGRAPSSSGHRQDQQLGSHLEEGCRKGRRASRRKMLSTINGNS